MSGYCMEDSMTIGGRWKFERFIDDMLAPRREVLVLNILRRKPLSAWDVWTIAQYNRPPLGWEDVELAIISLAKKGNITRIKEE